MFLIVSGGEAPENAFLRERAGKAEKVVAADKGAEYCLAAGVMPDLVVGDMDSLAPEALERLKEAGVPLKAHPALKDETDTRLALDEVMSMGAEEVEMIAATGDRFDHSLANVHLLHAAHARKVSACISSPRARIFLVSSSAVLRGMKGATVSLLPLTMEARGITLTGFQWILEGKDMALGDPYGVSNIVVADEARVTVREGILIAIVMPPVSPAGEKG